MPFKSEKQRRFLWAEHPDIAKRWAHKYPKSNKDLPMYADSDKKAALNVLAKLLVNTDNKSVTPLMSTTYGANVKLAKDGLTYVKIPHSDKPTYAGQEREQGEQNNDENCEKPKSRMTSILDEVNKAQDTTDPVLQKLGAVLAQPLRRAMEAAQAEEEGRDPRYVPQTMGIKRYSLPSAAVPPPIGSTAAPAPAPAQPAAAPITQPGNTPANSGPVGGGSNPMHNPIQAFGPLSSSGVINGNAAFGVKNSPDSLKTAAKGQPNWYGAENLVQTPTGYYHGYTHGVDVRDETPGFLTRLFDRDPYVMRDDVQKIKKRLRAIRGLYVNEQPYRLEFSHKGQLTPEVRRFIDTALAKNAADAKTPCSCGCGDTVATCKCGPYCQCRKPGGSCYKAAEKKAKLGLWDRINAKRKRGEPAAKPGEKDYPNAKSWNKVTAISEKKSDSTPAWQRSEGKNEAGGLNEKGRKSYEREHGGDLKAPVTQKNPKGEAKKRQNSFCSRMCGMKRVNTGAKTKSDPDSRINKSLRKWNCKCGSAQDLLTIALGADS